MSIIPNSVCLFGPRENTDVTQCRFLTRIPLSIINRAIGTDYRRMMVSHPVNVVVNCCFMMVFDTTWEADINSALVRPIHGSHKVKLRASEHVGYYSRFSRAHITFARFMQ
ncbi:hypothetical protein PTI98_008743 [Pleurotus ostreatus]|nr:hypothetical protein PTI98_008743 [Pleurotus ostreatus]